MTLHHNHLEEKMKMLSPPQVLSPCPGLRGCWRNLWILLTHPHVSQQVWVSQSWLALHHLSTKKWSRQTSHLLIKHLRYICSLNREFAAISMLISFLEWVSGVLAPSGAWGRLAAAFSAYLCWLYLETQSWLSNRSRSVANFPSCHLLLCIPPPPLTWTPDSLPGGFISSCLEWLTLLTPRTQRGHWHLHTDESPWPGSKDSQSPRPWTEASPLATAIGDAPWPALRFWVRVKTWSFPSRCSESKRGQTLP